MAIDLADVTARLPRELRVSVGTDADIERSVEFLNRYARPGRSMTAAAVRRAETANPEPNRLMLLVDDASGALQAHGTVSDGGSWASPDGSWRLDLRVAGQWRRRGVGRALLARLEAHARGAGAARTVSGIRGDEPEGLRFAEAMGYRAYHQRIDSYLDPNSVDLKAFADPDAEATRLGIRLASYAELVRELGARLEAFQRELLAMVWAAGRDVPTPTPQPKEPPPFEKAKELFFAPGALHEPTTIVALREGHPVGATITDVKDDGAAYTHFTGVTREERGKGIALLLKLRAIAELKRMKVTRYGTTNDEANAAMRGINRRLGYTPEPATIMVEKRFT